MENEKRKVGDYTVLCAVNIGSREIILAENEQSTNGERFLCCYGERNDIFEKFTECAVGGDYIDATLFFAERIKQDAEKFRAEVEKLDIPVTVITQADCIPDHYKNDINGKIIAINPAILKPEYQRADRQLFLVTGGFGASANARGSAVFCKNLYDGKNTRYERMDVLGEVKPECMRLLGELQDTMKPLPSIDGQLSLMTAGAEERKEMKEFLDDLTTRDQRMMFAVLTMVHTADTKEQLDNDTEALLTTARKHLCQFGILKFQQLDGLNTAMPFGVRKIESFRTLTTESLAVFIPFRVQDICHTNGVYYGQNVISKNMIIADRRQLLNGNEFILGVSGGGKSFTAKGEVINQVLAGNADIIIIDPEREYSPLVRALGGEIINISATSPTHINAMDMNREYGDGANPVILKSEFIMSLCEQLIGGNNLGAVQKSIIDRCTASVYRTYQQNNYTGEVPTLQDFRAELLKQSEPEAQEIALAIELFTNGSLNTFAKKTNVNTDNRLICYDILDLGKQLMPIGMLVVLDSILNRITQNRAKGKNTFLFIDEIYLLFQHEYSANFLFTLWKRVRKYGAYATGITQNVDDLLQSHTARTMLANSEFIVMLNQASTDRLELAKLLNISDTQLSYITNVDAGHGLIKVGSSLVPFANKFPKNTKLYKLMTTKPGEGA